MGLTLVARIRQIWRVDGFPRCGAEPRWDSVQQLRRLRLDWNSQNSEGLRGPQMPEGGLWGKSYTARSKLGFFLIL